MTKKLLILLLFITLFSPHKAFSQNEIDFSELQISIWPEYDRPGVLVIYDIELSPDVELPADIKLRIPASAGAPHAVASGQPDGSLLYIPSYKQNPAGEWIELEFTTTSPDIWVEYYDPTLVKDGSSRSFEYLWPGDHSVGQLSVQVKQPVDATNMKITPNMGNGNFGPDGLVQYNANLGLLNSGQVFTLRTNYQKDTEGLSVTGLNVEPLGLADETSTSISSTFLNEFNVKIFLLGLGILIGTGLIVVGGLWFWQTEKNNKNPKPKYHNRRPVSHQAGGKESTVYCHHCGKRAQVGDRFCRSCGNVLRVNT